MSQLTPHWELTGYQVEALAWAWAVRPNTGHVKVSDLGTLTGTLAVRSVQGRKEKAELLGLCNRWEQVFLGAGRGGQGTGAGVRAFRAAILDRMARDLTWDETMVKAEGGWCIWHVVGTGSERRWVIQPSGSPSDLDLKFSICSTQGSRGHGQRQDGPEPGTDMWVSVQQGDYLFS